MCTLGLLWQQDPVFPLVLAANRDEFFTRPTRSAAPWPENPQLIGGQDQQAGGSWLLAHQQGRWAALTNLRSGRVSPPQNPPSRGQLVQLAVELTHSELVERLTTQGTLYAGFNLIWGDLNQAFYATNAQEKIRIQTLQPGVITLSNAPLGQIWPKTAYLAQGLQQWMTQPDPEALWQLLAQDQEAPVDQLPETGIPSWLELALSALYIQPFRLDPDQPESLYGTRSSTLLWYERQPEAGQWTLKEKRFDPQGQVATSYLAWPAQPAASTLHPTTS
ncbi:NRDE family protein [Marinospirillum sp.]|uniref:NRDE family protein n=1 Tax=Marinospirillum sp. TaxID=2183934 RepID=UPI003A844352